MVVILNYLRVKVALTTQLLDDSIDLITAAEHFQQGDGRVRGKRSTWKLLLTL